MKALRRLALLSLAVGSIYGSGCGGCEDVHRDDPSSSGTGSAVGSLLAAFGQAGFILSNPHSFDPSATAMDRVYAMVRDSSAIYLVGVEYTSATNARWRIEKRSLTDGGLYDGTTGHTPAFDTDGIVTSDPSVAVDEALAVAIDTTNSAIFIAGYQNDSTGDDSWRVEKRHTSDGGLFNSSDATHSPTFGTSGAATDGTEGTGVDRARGIVFESGSPSNIYVVGSDSSASSGEWKIHKRSASNGSLLTEVLNNPSGANDEPLALAVQSGFVYVVGMDRATTNAQWRLEKRDTGSLGLDTGSGFGGTNGFIQLNLGAGDDEARAIRADSSGFYVAGLDASTGGGRWRVEKRLLGNGNALWADTPDPSGTNSDEAFNLAIDGSALYVVGMDQSVGAGNTQWRIEKRNLTDGTFVTAFDTDGIVTINPSSGADECRAVAVDSSTVFVGGVDLIHGSSNAQWRLERLNLTTGARDTSFGTPGVVTSDPSGAADTLNALAVNSTGLFAVGSDSTPGGATPLQWRIEKRDPTTGNLDTAFDSDGIYTFNPGAGDEAVYALAIDSTFMYVVGDGGGGQWRIERRQLSDGLSPGANYPKFVSPGSSSGVPRAIAIDSTYMYVVGTEATGGQWWIEKLLLTTGGDGGWGTGMGVNPNGSASADVPLAVAVDAANIYVVGSEAATGQWWIEKRLVSSGATAGGGFPFGVNPSSGSDEARAIAIDASYMYVAGTDGGGNGGRWRIEKRLLTTGALETAFGTSGVVLSDPTTGADEPNALILDSGTLYIVGFEGGSSGNNRWRIEKRSATTGVLGEVTSDPSISTDSARALALDSTNIFVGGTDSVPGNLRWRVEKRTK